MFLKSVGISLLISPEKNLDSSLEMYTVPPSRCWSTFDFSRKISKSVTVIFTCFNRTVSNSSTWKKPKNPKVQRLRKLELSKQVESKLMITLVKWDLWASLAVCYTILPYLHRSNIRMDDQPENEIRWCGDPIWCHRTLMLMHCCWWMSLERDSSKVLRERIRWDFGNFGLVAAPR